MHLTQKHPKINAKNSLLLSDYLNLNTDRFSTNNFTAFQILNQADSDDGFPQSQGELPQNALF